MTSPDSSTRIGSSPAPRPEAGGYTPGTILADRYRIVALLGRGGMGEVYRADDLKLGQPVALKFLPADVERDADARARLLAEARNARSIAHPNVCRVYDVGDIDARPFLTMEYIDGEDLASLLRRIGRLPAAKAVEIAQQVCAGLAAAHERGVLHRDLKPANVMIDGRGHARITDFGLALRLADELESARSGQAVGAGRGVAGVAGTLAYMAPECLQGKAATIQSDLYALGLILYETSTGQRPFKAETLDEWRAVHASSTPTPPTELSGDVAPAVERVILRCLEKDPARRPASAAQVAAGLPGGDPLAAAVAAGETPSPELVAASGEEGTLPRRTAWLWLGGAVLALALAAFVGQWVGLSNLLSFDGSPEVLQARARTMLSSFGYTERPRDSAWSIEIEPAGWTFDRPGPGTPRLDGVARIRPTLVTFRYRQAPAFLRPRNAGGRVSDNDPAPVAPHDIVVHLDTTGRLAYLRVLPPRREQGADDVQELDWSPLLAAAGISDTSLTSEAPRAIPPVAFDTRHAWTGRLDGVPFRFEAAALDGRIVFAQWGSAGEQIWVPGQTGNRALDSAVALVWILMAGGIVLLARRNVRLGRGDRRGARRVAGFVLATGAAWGLLDRHWFADPTWLWDAFETGLGPHLFWMAFVWLAYLALEPFVRRTWPHMLIAWARLIDGRWRDPLVGQALLAGIGLGSFIAVAGAMATSGGSLLGLAGGGPFYWRGLQSAESYLGFICDGLRTGTVHGLALVATMVACRFVLRSDRATFAAAALVVALNAFFPIPPLAFQVTQAALIGLASVVVARRFGVLALTAGFVGNIVLRSTPWTFDLAKWFAWRPILSVLLIIGLALWGFRNVLGRQSPFPKLRLD